MEQGGLGDGRRLRAPGRGGKSFDYGFNYCGMRFSIVYSSFQESDRIIHACKCVKYKHL
jgi:hypothetical protein